MSVQLSREKKKRRDIQQFELFRNKVKVMREKKKKANNRIKQNDSKTIKLSAEAKAE